MKENLANASPKRKYMTAKGSVSLLPGFGPEANDLLLVSNVWLKVWRVMSVSCQLDFSTELKIMIVDINTIPIHTNPRIYPVLTF